MDSQSAAKNKWIILFLVVMVTFMSCLDSSIVNVALPVMTKALNTSTVSIQWVVTSYLLTISACILIFGRLGDAVGKTTVFLFGLALFTIGSFLCGISHTLSFLIIARVIQAFGAGATMANNQGIVTETFGPGERGKALGITGTFVALGSLAGPPLGGFIVGAFRWEMIFFINVPIGILVFIFGLKLFPKEKKRDKVRLDIPGALLFMVSMVSLFLTIGQEQSMSLLQPSTLIGFLIAVGSFAAFLFIEKRQAEPILYLPIFRNWLFSLSLFCAFTSFVSIFCNTIIQPFYLQDVMKFSPAFTGILLMIYPLVLSVVAPLSGAMSDKIGSEILTFFGLFITSAGLLLMSTLSEKSSILQMILFTAVMSVGNGLFQSPNNSLIMSTAPKDKLGIAGSINALVRNFGMICGVTLATTILYNRMSARLGYPVNNFVEGRNDIFIYGMSVVYITAAAICMTGAVLTAVRLISRRKSHH